MLFKILEYFCQNNKESLIVNEIIKKYYHVYDFYTSNYITCLTIIRYINFTKNIFLLNNLIQKDIYIPGVGKFSYNNKKNMFDEIKNSGITPKIKKIFNDGKINYLMFNSMIFQVINEDTKKYTWLSSINSKCFYLNKKIFWRDLLISDFFIEEKEKYSFLKLKKSWKENESWIDSILEYINLDEFLINKRLWMDILFSIVILDSIEKNFI